MIAEIHKIRDDIPSSPKTLLGMLQGYSDKITHIAAVVFWDDGSFQLVNDPITLSEHALALAIMQRELMNELADRDSRRDR